MKYLFTLIILCSLFYYATAEMATREEWDQKITKIIEALELEQLILETDFFSTYNIAIMPFTDENGTRLELGNYFSDELGILLGTNPKIGLQDRFAMESLILKYNPVIFPDLEQKLIDRLIALDDIDLIITGTIETMEQKTIITPEIYKIRKLYNYPPETKVQKLDPLLMPSVDIYEISGLKTADLSGNWDFRVDVYQTLNSSGQEEWNSTVLDFSLHLGQNGNVLSGKMLELIESNACDEAVINGSIDKLQIEFITRYTGSCCTNSELKFTGELRLDGEGQLFMFGRQEPVSAPQKESCLLWWAMVKGVKR